MELIFNTITITFSILFALSIWGVVGMVISFAYNEGDWTAQEAFLMSIAWPVFLVAALHDVIDNWIEKL